MPTRPVLPQNARIAQRLWVIAGQLRDGQRFNSIRLTLLKRPCEDPIVAGAFALSLAEKTLQNADEEDAHYIDAARLLQYRQLMAHVVETMRDLIATPTLDKRVALTTAVAALAKMQSTYVNVAWNTVREIECNDAYVVELAGQCQLDTEQAGPLAYRLARAYAERYNPRYGTGLIPESAPLVEDIATFWANRP